MATILILHGPNLNMLGNREPSVYGTEKLTMINDRLYTLAQELGHSLEICQSNAEHILIERIQKAESDATAFIIINPAAYTHTSIALRDSLLAVSKPFVEVHLSNIYRREPFRKHSYFSDIAIGTLTGLGAEGYLLAVRYAHHYLTTSSLKQ